MYYLTINYLRYEIVYQYFDTASCFEYAYKKFKMRYFDYIEDRNIFYKEPEHFLCLVQIKKYFHMHLAQLCTFQQQEKN